MPRNAIMTHTIPRTRLASTLLALLVSAACVACSSSPLGDTRQPGEPLATNPSPPDDSVASDESAPFYMDSEGSDGRARGRKSWTSHTDAPPLAVQRPTRPSSAHHESETQATLREAAASGNSALKISVRLSEPPGVVLNLFKVPVEHREQTLADYYSKLAPSQDAMVSQLATLGGRELDRKFLSNHVVVEIPANRVPELLSLPGVIGIARTRKETSSTIPSNANGYDGNDIRNALRLAYPISGGLTGAGISIGILGGNIIPPKHWNLEASSGTPRYAQWYCGDSACQPIACANVTFRLQNRWVATEYMQQVGSALTYGALSTSDSQVWQIQGDANGYFVLTNVASGQVMSTQDKLAYAEVLPYHPTWSSEEWTANTTSDGYLQFVNRWTNDMLNVQDQTGYVERGAGNPGWWSADWTLVLVSSIESENSSTCVWGIKNSSGNWVPLTSTQLSSIDLEWSSIDLEQADIEPTAHGSYCADVAGSSVEEGQDPSLTTTSDMTARSGAAPGATIHNYIGSMSSALTQAVTNGDRVVSISVGTNCFCEKPAATCASFCDPTNDKNCVQVPCDPTIDYWDLSPDLLAAENAGTMVAVAAGDYPAGMGYPAVRPEVLAVGWAESHPNSDPNPDVAPRDPSASTGPLTFDVYEEGRQSESAIGLIAPGCISMVETVNTAAVNTNSSATGPASVTCPGDICSPVFPSTAYAPAGYLAPEVMAGPPSWTWYPGCGASFSTPLVSGGIAILAQAYTKNAWGFSGWDLMAAALAQGDGFDDTTGNLRSTGLSSTTGAGHMHVHYPLPDYNLGGTWGWAANHAIINQATTQYIQIGVMPANTTEWKFALVWNETDMTNAAAIDVYVESLGTGNCNETPVVLASQTDFDIHKRVRLTGNEVANQCLRVRVYGYSVPVGGRIGYYASYWDNISFRLQNRWAATEYMQQLGSTLQYGPLRASSSQMWQMQRDANGYVVLTNVASGQTMSVQDQAAYAEVLPYNSTWWSEEWTVTTTSDGYLQFVNRWTNDMLNVQDQTGYVERGAGNTGWWSADWILVPVN